MESEILKSLTRKNIANILLAAMAINKSNLMISLVSLLNHIYG